MTGDIVDEEVRQKAPSSVKSVFRISQGLLTKRVNGKQVNPSDYTFVFMGDNRNRPECEFIFAQVLSKATSKATYSNRKLPFPAFILHGGDIVQTGTVANLKHFRRQIGLDSPKSSLKVPIFITPGNHDRSGQGRGKKTIQNFVKYIGPNHFVLGGSALDKLNLRVISVDSSPWVHTDGKDIWELETGEAKFLADRGKGISSKRLLFVMTHTPPAGSAFLKIDPTHVLNPADSKAFLSSISQIKKAKKNLRLVLVSHMHCYLPDGKTHHETSIQGVRYLLSGGAGAPRTCPPFHFFIIHVLKGVVQTPIFVSVKITPPKSKPVCP